MDLSLEQKLELQQDLPLERMLKYRRAQPLDLPLEWMLVLQLVRPLDLRSIALAVEAVSDLAKRVEADALLCVSQLVLKRIAALQEANHREARLIYPLIDALDRACLEAMEFNVEAEVTKSRSNAFATNEASDQNL